MINLPSLVLEGGGFRGVFTQGVLDALLDYDIMFPYVIGVSAGISNGYSYVSRQRGRNWEIAAKYYNDKRYYGYGNYLKNKSVFGLEFMFETVPNELLPYDYEELANYKGQILAGLTHGVTGEPRYFSQNPTDKTNKILRATCSIPFFFPPVDIEGEEYFDGGIADPIPVKKAVSDGNKKHLIVLTQPKGYKKEATKTNEKGANFLKKNYPGTAQVMLERFENYNKHLNFCHELENKGEAIVLHPKRATVVERFERDIDKLRLLYEDGYIMCKANIEKIKEMF
ncbi:MAG: patatin family protein [Clostridiales bacterium]